jgi:hypothetical protein
MTSDQGSGIPASLSAEQGAELFELMAGYRVSQAIYAVASLGIPDLLASGPQDCDELARATGTHAPTLFRVLRFLAGAGLFEEAAPRQFGLTPLGTGLRTDVPGSMRLFALMMLDESHWLAWGNLLHSVRTGETAFQHTHSMGAFDYYGKHPAIGAIFNQAMTSNTARSGAAITQAYDFSGIQRLVDVGGGHGLLLATVLRAHPTMRGVLFDRPEVVAGASAQLEAVGVADRCEVVGGDFFVDIPTGGDAYVLRNIIHDWDDERALQILKNCSRAMRGQGKLLVVERTIAPDYRQAMPVLHLDLEMLVVPGGAQRTEAEYRTLFGAAGFGLTAVVPLNDPSQYSVFEGVPG